MNTQILIDLSRQIFTLDFEITTDFSPELCDYLTNFYKVYR